MLQADFNKCIYFTRNGSSIRTVPDAITYVAMHDIIEYVEETIDINNPSAPNRKVSTTHTLTIDDIASKFIDEITSKTEINNNFNTASITSSNPTPDAVSILKNAYTLELDNLKTILNNFVNDAISKRLFSTAKKNEIQNQYNSITTKLVDEIKTFFKSIEDDDVLYTALYGEYDTVTLDGSRRKDCRSRTLNLKSPKNRKKLLNKILTSALNIKSPKNQKKTLNKILASLRPC